MYVCVFVCVCVCVCVGVWVCGWLCGCVCVCVCAYVFVCVSFTSCENQLFIHAVVKRAAAFACVPQRQCLLEMQIPPCEKRPAVALQESLWHPGAHATLVAQTV